MLEITYSKVGDFLIPNLVMDERSEGGIDALSQRQKDFPQEAQEGHLRSASDEQHTMKHLTDTSK